MSQTQFGRMLPLWYQTGELLKAHIRQRAAAGDLRIAPENQLATEFGVSLNTMRQALTALEHEGWVSRTRRRGTAITALPPTTTDLKVWGTLASVWNSEFKDPPKLLAKRKMKTPAHLLGMFDAVPMVTFMQRLRMANGVPINYAVNYLLPELGDRIEKADIEKFPISRILQEKLGANISRMDYAVEALAASAEIAEFLALEPGSPVLFFRALVFDERDRLLEVGEIYYRPESFKFEVSINMR